MAFRDLFSSGKKPNLRKTVKGSNARSFTAAKINRLSADFNPQNVSIDWDLRTQLPMLQARSRHLCTNNPYAKKFLGMFNTHVVGPVGFDLQMKVFNYDAQGNKTPDKLANAVIADHFWKWARTGMCDVTGKHSFVDIQRICAKGLAREGEVLMRKVYGDNAGEYGYKLQLLDIDRLDVNHNEQLPGGNIVKMGVELTPEGKPVAYHLKTVHPGDTVYYTYRGSTYIRVPAAEIIHAYVNDRPEQTRGYPELAAVMMSTHQLSGYEESAVVAARVGATKMGFFQTPDGTAADLSDEETADGEFLTDAEPGIFDTLPPGYEFKEYNPEYPTAMYAPFVKKALQGIASGMGVSYNTLANDLEGVSFSSIRSGVLEERDCWMVIQNWFAEHILEIVFSDWLKFALLKGAITFPSGKALPAASYNKFNSFLWKGRRWQWVDPKNDADASILQINAGLKSRKDVAAEQGIDIEEVAQQLSEEEKEFKRLGVTITLGQPGQQSTASTAPAKPAA